MANKPSRTTKKARSILRNEQVDVAVPAERILDDPEGDTGSLFDRARRTAASGSEEAFVLALLGSETALLSSKSSNPGLPDRLVDRLSAKPSIVADDGHGLRVELDQIEYLVSPIHADALRAHLQSDGSMDPDGGANSDKVDDTVDTAQAEPEPLIEEPNEAPQDTVVDSADEDVEEDTAGAAATVPEEQVEPAPDPDASVATTTEEDDPLLLARAETADDPVDAPAPTEPVPAGSPPVDAVPADADWSDGPLVPINKATTWTQRLAPELPIVYAVPCTAEQPVLSAGEAAQQRNRAFWRDPIDAWARRSSEGQPDSVVVAFGPSNRSWIFTADRRNRARPDRLLMELPNAQPAPKLETIDGHQVRLRVGERSFIVEQLYAHNLGAFLDLEDREAGMAPLKNAWTEVAREFEQQMRIPEEFIGTVENRSRPTIQCQRLLKDHWVALAVPVSAQPRPGTDDPKGNHVIAFTDQGPILFASSRGNPALPRHVIGPIEDASPVSFGPHDREGGVLTFNERTFLVPHAYADSLRQLIFQMSQD